MTAPTPALVPVTGYVTVEGYEILSRFVADVVADCTAAIATEPWRSRGLAAMTRAGITLEELAWGQVIEFAAAAEARGDRLARRLTMLHRHGYWIDAWYPLGDDGQFECRIRDDAAVNWHIATGGVDRDALTALELAMSKAGIPLDEPEEDS